MKSLLILLFTALALILTCCSKNEYIINLENSSIKREAISSVDINRGVGDTVIVAKYVSERSGERGLYHIINRPSMGKGWMEYDSTYNTYIGASFFKTTIVEVVY